jgi:hippurate hydrolase
VKKIIESLLPQIILLRQKLHMFPELGFDEHKTAEIVCNALKGFGINNVITGVGKTGVVAEIDSGNPGKTIMLRADMDGLNVEESTGLTYSSQHPGRMHACGHDGHMAILLCVAAVLSKKTKEFSGKIVFVFQPAAEMSLGGKAMIQDGFLEKYQFDKAFALHTSPVFMVGNVALKSKNTLACMQVFRMKLEASCGLMLMPEGCANLINLVARLQSQLQSKARELSATDIFADVSFSKIESESSESFLVTPRKLFLEGVIRVEKIETLGLLKKCLQELYCDVVQKHSLVGELVFENFCPPVDNSITASLLVQKVVGGVVGKERLYLLEKPLYAVDDFAYFLEKIPGCLFFVGNGALVGGRVSGPMLHTSKFDFNDKAISSAAEIFCNLVLECFNH